MIKTDDNPTVTQLYPQLSPEEQKQAQFWLDRYLDVIKDIWESTASPQEEDLTQEDGDLQ